MKILRVSEIASKDISYYLSEEKDSRKNLTIRGVRLFNKESRRLNKLLGLNKINKTITK